MPAILSGAERGGMVLQVANGCAAGSNDGKRRQLGLQPLRKFHLGVEVPDRLGN